MNAYVPPSEIYFGAGQIEKLPEILKKRNLNNIALFASGSVLKNECVQNVLSKCEKSIQIQFDKIRSDPEVEAINEAIAKAQGLNLDGIVAIGGGSVIDFGKAFGAGFSNECRVEDFYTGVSSYAHSLPLIAIPTTSGTGSEVTRAAALTYQNAKKPIFDNSLTATVAIIDPELTISCPPLITASCGLDVLSHSLESLMHNQSGVQSEKYALSAADKVLKNLEKCFVLPGDFEYRKELAEASMQAGLAIAYSGCTVSHACSYALTTEYRLPHGEACAFTLDGVLRLCAMHDSRMDHYAKLLGFDSANSLADRVSEIKKATGMRCTLEQIGASQDAAIHLAEAAMASPVIKNHYFLVKYEEILNIFEGCR